MQGFCQTHCQDYFLGFPQGNHCIEQVFRWDEFERAVHLKHDAVLFLRTTTMVASKGLPATSHRKTVISSGGGCKVGIERNVI